MSAVKRSPGFLEQAFTRISHKHFKKWLPLFAAKVMATSIAEQSVIFQYSVELRHQPIRARILSIGVQD